MLFRQLVFYALAVGVLAGLTATVAQMWQATPIILSAETFEAGQGASSPADDAGHQGHEHGEAHGEAWSPQDGLERTMYTLLANTLTALGFALVMLAAMLASAALPGRPRPKFGWRQGLLWGAAGYAVFWLAPAVGLPPEIPLQNAAPLGNRQLWWGLAVVCAGGGLAALVFVKSPWRYVGLGLLAIPYLVGAPHPDGPMFVGQPAGAGAELEELAGRFVWAAAFVGAAQWLVIGLACGWSARRILGKKQNAPAAAQTGAHSA